MSLQSDLIDYLETQLGLEIREIYITRKQMEQLIIQSIEFFEQHASMASQEFYMLLALEGDETDYDMPFRTRSVVDIIATSNPLDIFSVERHIIDNSIFNSAYRNTAGYNLLDIYMTRAWIQSARKMLQKERSFNFSETDNTVKLDAPPRFDTNVIIHGYAYLFDPDEEDNGVWTHPWIKKYALALCWIRVATNLKLYGSTPLPSGMTLDADFALSMGQEMQEKSEEELYLVYNEPADFYVG